MYKISMKMNINKLLLSFLFICILDFNALGDTIKEIEVTGNKRISKETIVLFGQIKLNQETNTNEINTILKKLYSTNFFKNIKIELSNEILKIDIIENPLVQSVNFEGVKNKSIIELLRENITLKEKSSFVYNIANNDKNKLSNILRTIGYYRSEVNPKYIENSNNTIDLIYEIYLGDKASIKKIKFIGDKKIKDRKLRNVITSEEDKFWKFITKNKYIDEQRIKLDEKLLKNYYKNNGYYKVKIDSSSVQFVDNDEFTLTFKIEAGKKYYFNKFSLDLPSEYNLNNFNDINKIFSKLEGKKYSLDKIEKILKEIDKIALTKEYEFIDASYNEIIVNNNQINLSIKLFESEKYYVERINVFGNFITEEKVIRNSLIIDEGDALNEILLNKSINNIKSKGIFKKVEKIIKDGTKKNNKIIEINLEEKPTGEIFAGVGTGTNGTSMQAGIKENNYLGTGVKLNTNLTLSNNKSTGIFSVINPNYKNTDKSSNFRVEVSEEDQLTNYGYKSGKEGFILGLNYEQYTDIFFSPSISVYHEDLETSDNASATKKKQAGSYFDTEFRYGLTLNKLNSNFQPTDGFKSSFNQTIPIITEEGTIVNSYRLSKFHPIKDNMTFSVRFLATAVNSLTNDDVRLTKRAYIPDNRLRGFASGKIGPTDSGDYIGGNYASALNINTTLPSLFPDLQELDFNLFLDAANVWGVDYDSTLDSNKVRTSTGLSVDWYTPIGPLSFSFAVPMSKAESDTTETFRFNIGTTF